MSSTTEQPCEHNWKAWTISVMEHGHWKTWLNSMTPERLAQQRAYDRERIKKYNQDHKEERTQYRKEHYQENKDHYCEKHVCETCGGQYTTHYKTQHLKTKIHQDAVANVSPACFKCDLCGGRYTPQNKARHLTSKKHQHAMHGI